MEKMVNRMEQTLYGPNGDGLRSKFDKLDKKVTLAGAAIFGLQVALTTFLILQQINAGLP